MPENYDVIVIFPIYDQFGAIRKPDSGCIVNKTYIFINSNRVSYINLTQNYNISNTALTLLLWVKVLFLLKKALFFLKENADITKIKKALARKDTYVCVLKITFVCVLTCQISSF